MTGQPFRKMQGLGNDFVVLDARTQPLSVALTPAMVQHMADRRYGIGCDQLIVLDSPPPSPSPPTPEDSGQRAHVRMRIYNADGGEVLACGNATRCVGRLLLDDGTADTCALILTGAGLLQARRHPAGIAVDMGTARTSWQDVPLAQACESLHVPGSWSAEGYTLTDGAACSIGNPHVTFFVPDVAAAPLSALGARVEHDPLFPQRVNVGVAQVDGQGALHLRVWERGAGATLACGTAACAAAVNAARRGLCGSTVTVHLPGGTLTITTRPASTEAPDGWHVTMAGGAEYVFSGIWPA